MGSLQQLRGLYRSFSISPRPSVLAADSRRSLWVRGCISVSGTAQMGQPQAAAEEGNLILKSKEVMVLEAKVVAGTYARVPVVLSSGKGCELYDPEWREYLDRTSGIAVNALGHGDPDWVRAVTEQSPFAHSCYQCLLFNPPKANEAAIKFAWKF